MPRRPLTNLLQGCRLALRQRRVLRVNHRYLGLFGGRYLGHLESFRRSNARVIVIEDTDDVAVVLAAKRVGLRCVACPQNVEALCAANDSLGARFPQSLHHELQCLSWVDRVFCISREEQWFMRCSGVPAEYFPYFPPSAVLCEMAEVRRRRAGNSKTAFLILGSVVNRFTSDGIRELIRLLDGLQEQSFTFRIAGFGTEALAREWTNPRFTFLGSLPSDGLQEELSSCRAMILHQEAGAGALTRIVEALLGGVPVIANAIAARSHWSYPLRVYDTAEQLFCHLSNYQPDPPVPAEEKSFEARFLAALSLTGEPLSTTAERCR